MWWKEGKGDAEQERRCVARVRKRMASIWKAGIVLIGGGIGACAASLNAGIAWRGDPSQV